MDAKSRAAHRRTLENLQAETLAAGPAKIDPNRKDASTVGVADEDEQALSEMLQVLASQRNQKQTSLLNQIEHALRKLDRHPEQFGMCEDCEEDIDVKRLRLMPHASLCAECQAKRDPRRGQARKKVTDYR